MLDTTQTTKSTCPDNVRFAVKEKFPTKVLVWIAISARGMFKPLIRPSNSEAIKSDICINEDLEKRLLPFIHEYHQDLNYMFWPNLASAHYSAATVGWMDKNINYVNHQPTKRSTGTPNQELLGLVVLESVRGRLGSHKRAAVDSPNRVQVERFLFEKMKTQGR